MAHDPIGGDSRTAAAAQTSGVTIRYNSASGWWVIIATVLGSGIAFLDSTVVNVALPAIERDLGGGLAGLQWTVDAYLLTLGSLIIFGGSLGDLFGRRRIFVVGLVSFSLASALCGVAPNIVSLIVARAVQGIGGALLVPSSLAIISTSFHPDDRGRALGAWSGLSGVGTALGPFLGGYLVDAVSWRWVFLINLPLAAVTIWATLARVPEARAGGARARPDVRGAGLGAAGLGGLVFALIEGPVQGLQSPAVVAAGALGLAALGALFWLERRIESPMLPLGIFRSRQFSGANAATFAVYGALGGAMFLLIIQLQQTVGYSALQAGAAFLPTTLILLALSPRMGGLAQRIGPRWPMTFGPLLAGAGLVLLAGVGPGSGYLGGVLPGVIVFGLGLTLTVTPLTSAVLAAVEQPRAGIASGINNAVARLAGLVAVAVVPFLAGLTGGTPLEEGFGRALMLCAALCTLGGLISLVTIRQSVPLRALVHLHPDLSPARRSGEDVSAA